MISCYGGASEAVNSRIGSVWKKFTDILCVSREARFISEATVEDLSVSDQTSFAALLVQQKNKLEKNQHGRFRRI